LVNEDGIPVAFYITEDEFIYFRGYCTKCGKEIEFRYSILEMLFDCPKDRKVN
jgi:prepilin signal peptidase PulO-like enzyme (type II secretory pathway)